MSGAELKAAEQAAKDLLQPFVRSIDADAYYAKPYLIALGASGLLDSRGREDAAVRERGVRLGLLTSRICMTTGFNLWCHLAALTYARHSVNGWLHERLLPQLERGKRLGGTGLSNPMKHYAGMEELRLRAERTEDGRMLHGLLPTVSNLGDEHWFGVVAGAATPSNPYTKPVMLFVPCDVERLALSERTGYLGINGSATYACRFDGVRVPDEWIIDEDADAFVSRIRATFVLYQIPLGLGVLQSAVQAVRRQRETQGGASLHLPVGAEQLGEQAKRLEMRLLDLAAAPDLDARWREVLQLRLDTAYAALQGVQSEMLHRGGSAYTLHCSSSRRLREAYFFAALTPTVKHLEQLLNVPT
ncbi:acyl-CoA/acyl-ACP dehydrogenase [Paenibacillus sp. IB182496]|uniref:Acyl-CoA/acyl-ACP dehydrogenase n=1 Tax=Paenibacillus sabuli TaxID=2772509 RepID=A0A927BRR8_9BACL|nr:acyl-CoA dehydrogenase family protein [Paenibacillus sabuli]MBD2844268.1 acyl-CoA/acyl-ACP dehydrogenase [Paenibacillus sabuli]